MHIGILLTGHSPDPLVPLLGDYDAMFRKLLDGHDFTFETWSAVDMEFPNSVHAADGWLITGSKHGVYEDHPFIPPLEQVIQAAFMENVPLVGVCFGHQIIAQAFGGKVEKSDRGWGVGLQHYDFGGTQLPVNTWHQDQVIEAPDLATTVAGNDFCPHGALLYGPRAFSVQCHPEFGDEMIQGLINTRGPGVVPETRLAYAQAQIGKPNANAILADQIASFFKTPRDEPDAEVQP